MNTGNDADAASAESLQAEHHRAAEEERDDAWWYRVYAAVLVVAVLTITGLWIFSRAFSA